MMPAQQRDRIVPGGDHPARVQFEIDQAGIGVLDQQVQRGGVLDRAEFQVVVVIEQSHATPLQHRAAPVEQAAKRGHFSLSGNPRDHLLDITAPFEFGGVSKERGFGCGQFGAALGKIGFTSPDLDAAMTKLRDVFGAREQAIIEVERGPFNLKGRDLLAQRSDARGGSGFIRRRPLQDIGGIGIERDHGPKRLNGAVRLRVLSHVAANAANTVEPAQTQMYRKQAGEGRKGN